MGWSGYVLVINNKWILQWGGAGNTDWATYAITFNQPLGGVCSILGDSAHYMGLAMDWYGNLTQFHCHRSIAWGWKYIAIGT